MGIRSSRKGKYEEPKEYQEKERERVRSERGNRGAIMRGGRAGRTSLELIKGIMGRPWEVCYGLDVSRNYCTEKGTGKWRTGERVI